MGGAGTCGALSMIALGTSGDDAFSNSAETEEKEAALSELDRILGSLAAARGAVGVIKLLDFLFGVGDREQNEEASP